MSSAPGNADELRQACHDLRQPIAGVLALAGAALTDADLPEQARDYLSKIVGLAEWQAEVVEHWLRTPGTWPPATHACWTSVFPTTAAWTPPRRCASAARIRKS
jgi:hypothetical protein